MHATGFHSGVDDDLCSEFSGGSPLLEIVLRWGVNLQQYCWNFSAVVCALCIDSNSRCALLVVLVFTTLSACAIGFVEMYSFNAVVPVNTISAWKCWTFTSMERCCTLTFAVYW